MRFSIFGLSISSSWGNGHATIWRALCKALIARGHRICFFEKDVPYYAAHRDLTAIPGLDLHLYPDWESIAPTARECIERSDMAMVTSFCPDGIAAGDLVCGATRAIRIFYDLDTPVTLASLAQDKKIAYIGPRGLQDYDLVLSFTGGGALDALRQVLHARRVVAFYGCVDPDAHAPAPADDDFHCDLSYLGTYAQDRQAALEELFIKPARLLPQRRFLLGGSLYPQQFPWTPNIYYVRHVDPARHPAFFSSSRFTLNITRSTMAAMGYCPSGRLFEAAACGVPILTDEWEGLSLFFTPGKELAVAHTAQDITEFLVMDENRRDSLIKAARCRVLSEHTAAARIDQLERVLVHL